MVDLAQSDMMSDGPSGRDARGVDATRADDSAREPRPALRRVGLLIRKAYRALGQLDPFPNTTLAGRILGLNLTFFVLLVLVTLLIGQYRSSLIEQRLEALKAEADLIAISIADSAGRPLNQTYDWVTANEILRRLSLPTGLRAQIYDRNGRLSGDTRSLNSGEPLIEQHPLVNTSPVATFYRRLEEVYFRVLEALGKKLELYKETPPTGISQSDEVYQALAGEVASAQRINSESELILSVATPVKRVKTVLGALVLSTEGGDIDRIVAQERLTLSAFFGMAFILNGLFSAWLAASIARPIRRLALAAESNEQVGREPTSTQAAEIPEYKGRADEIGYLAIAMRRMTSRLYDRIGAIESFAADVSHEIKNPLTSLRSAVESFAFAKTDAQKEKLLNVIRHDVDRLDRLVTDISNASRLDAELVREQREQFNVYGLLETVVDIAAPKAEETQVTVSLAPPPEGSSRQSCAVRGLQDRLAQVFHNLLDNALSFSKAGDQIVMQARPDQIDGRPAIRIEVIDQGPGVPEDNLESIFKRFYSSRPETESFGQHSGLGLSICKQIVEAHGGRIWAENREDGDGAIFSVVVPK